MFVFHVLIDQFLISIVSISFLRNKKLSAERAKAPISPKIAGVSNKDAKRPIGLKIEAR